MTMQKISTESISGPSLSEDLDLGSYIPPKLSEHQNGFVKLRLRLVVKASTWCLPCTTIPLSR